MMSSSFTMNEDPDAPEAVYQLGILAADSVHTKAVLRDPGCVPLQPPSPTSSVNCGANRERVGGNWDYHASTSGNTRFQPLKCMTFPSSHRADGEFS